MNLTAADEAAERVIALYDAAGDGGPTYSAFINTCYGATIKVARAYQSLRAPVEGMREAREVAMLIVGNKDLFKPAYRGAPDYISLKPLEDAIAAAIDSDRATLIAMVTAQDN